MTIFRGSRYSRLKVTNIRDVNGRLRQFLHDRSITDIEDLLGDFTLFTVTIADRLDNIAFENSGRPTLWWVIADINGLQGLFDIKPGDKLVIPNTAFFARF